MTTRTYASPPYLRPLPDLDTCSESDLIDLAAHMLSAPTDLPAGYVERLSKVIESLSLQLEVAHAFGLSMRAQLANERASNAETVASFEAEATRSRIKLAEAQGAAANADHLHRKLCAAVLAITGRTADEIQEEHEFWSRVEQADSRRRMVNAQRASAVREAYQANRMDWDPSEITDVVDVNGFEEPAFCRTVTPRAVVPSMAEIVGGGA